MPDGHTVVTRLLGVMGVAHKWHVVEPVPGDSPDGVWIRNEEEKLEGYVRLTPSKAESLSDDEIIALIRLAIARATADRYQRS